MKRILISGYFGFDNSGDDAILKAIVDDFQQLNIELELTALSKNPAKTKMMYGIHAVDRFSLKEVISTLRHTDLLLSGGGSLLQDITSTRSIVYYLSVIFLAKICGVKVYVYANGVGPIDKKFNRLLTKWVLSGADYITLRDKLSYEFIQELKVDNPHMEVTADPVFSLEAVGEEEAHTILQLEGLEISDNCIGMCIRPWNRAPGMKEELVRTIDELTSRGYPILMLPLHYPLDLTFSQEVRKLCRQPDQIQILTHSYRAEQLMGIFKKLKMVVAMRLHSLVYASNAQLPIVGLIYDPKVEGLLKELHIDRYVNAEEFTSQELLGEICETLETLEDKKEALLIHTEKMKQRALRNVEIAVDILKQ